MIGCGGIGNHDNSFVLAQGIHCFFRFDPGHVDERLGPGNHTGPEMPADRQDADDDDKDSGPDRVRGFLLAYINRRHDQSPGMGHW